MGEPTDAAALVKDLNAALPFQYRCILACAIAAGALPGVQGVALAEALRDMAAADLRDAERIAARVASLGGTPTANVARLQSPRTWRAILKRLVEVQQEALDALVEAIPADADDAEGEATEHLLEHVIARKRDDLELLQRALR